jgi:hypothetical protein
MLVRKDAVCFEKTIVRNDTRRIMGIVPHYFKRAQSTV